MRIVQINNVGYVGAKLKEGLNQSNYDCELIIKNSRLGVFKDIFRLIKYDVIHYHGNSLLVNGFIRNLDIKLLKFYGKKLFLEFHGSDLRIAMLNEKIKFLKCIDKIFVSTPDLLEYLDEAVWLPSPVLDKGIVKLEDKEVLNIGYRFIEEFKDYELKEKIYTCQLIRKVLEELKKEGYKINIVDIYGLKGEDYFRVLSQLDLFIDKLGVDWYSQMACEVGMFGIPVISRFKEDIMEVPFIEGRNNLEKAVKIFFDYKYRRKKGLDCRRYVYEVHNVNKVIPSLLGYYNE